jgi:hypothetical protein
MSFLLLVSLLASAPEPRTSALGTAIKLQADVFEYRAQRKVYCDPNLVESLAKLCNLLDQALSDAEVEQKKLEGLFQPALGPCEILWINGNAAPKAAERVRDRARSMGDTGKDALIAAAVGLRVEAKALDGFADDVKDNYRKTCSVGR